tara:strand:+ start:835 stop:993 length:159 start_codon:yes stop_codon:yes gene_type:complete
MELKGIGDSIEQFTRTTGLKTLTEIASKAMGYEDCGCNDRKNWLNKQFPYKQ